tara:strand:+ start:1138 stop:2064 length:927 start_codon:yes stop_codon:yes gene_type:complete
MKRTAITLLFTVLFFCGQAVAAEPRKETMSFGGLHREYTLYTPDDLPSRAGLVIAMHGYSSSAQNISAYSGLNALADEHGFVVAYPQGTEDQNDNAFFNVGYAFHAESTVDDVGFILALVERLLGNQQIDSDRVYATGMSNGGDMSYLLACEAPDVFRAVAPVAGTMMVATAAACTPSRVISVLSINGTADNVTRYAGDLANADGWGAYLSVDEIVNLWIKQASVKKSTSKVLDFSGDDRIALDHYSTDSGAPELLHYRVEGGGHDWPGARFAWWDLRRLVSVYAMGFGEHRSFDASEKIVEFFNKNK